MYMCMHACTVSLLARTSYLRSHLIDVESASTFVWLHGGLSNGEKGILLGSA